MKAEFAASVNSFCLGITSARTRVTPLAINQDASLVRRKVQANMYQGEKEKKILNRKKALVKSLRILYLGECNYGNSLHD